MIVQPKNLRPVDYVDPFVGTDFYANTFPGPGLPSGMIHLSPDTDTTGWDYCSGYLYRDHSIMGFSHTHYSGTGWPSKGEILLMPTIGQEIQINPGPRINPDSGYRSRFSHSKEQAKPGYYSVFLDDYKIKVELTSTQRVGMHRYTFPESNDAHVLLDIGHMIGEKIKDDAYINFVNDREIEGYKPGHGAVIYFVAKFNKPFHTGGVWDKNYDKPETDMYLNPYKTAEKGNNIGAFINYQTKRDEVILVKVALSYISIDGARKNLEAEIPHWDFDQISGEAERIWDEALSVVEVEGDKSKKQIFYTSLYHSLLAMNISSDVDGKYMGMDDKIHQATDFQFYPSFYAWDTYRSQHPLITLLTPGQVDDLLKSIESKVRNYGWLPAQHVRNNFGQGMAGDHLVAIIVDAYQKGFRDFDVDLVYESMKRKALHLPPAPHPKSEARAGLEYYLDLGYTPADKIGESVANTLELAYDDWCIAQMAKALGKQTDYNLFMRRAKNYENLFDPESQFMRPRKVNGEWLPDCKQDPQIEKDGDHYFYGCFDPLWVGIRPFRHYAESNAWQYLWFVPHDLSGLISLFGGKDNFIKKLDKCLTMSPVISGPNYVGVVGTIGQYVHGNQPSHHVMYLYNYAGQPWKSQYYVRKVMNELYRTGPGGLCGNEDMGSLSSWYVFSALGFYPVCPGENRYMIGSPLFEKSIIHLRAPYKKTTFEVIAKNVSDDNIYIQSAHLDGQPLNQPWIMHNDIVKGGTLVFDMGPRPNKHWGN
jgi:predicted alpha-1,2-mannosidase